MVKVKKDLTGQIFERLTVLKQAEDYISPNGKHHCQWLCECNCKKDNKNLVIVRGAGLHSKKTLSCGCLSRERLIVANKEKKKKYNQYDLTGEYGVGWTASGKEFYFDLEDYDKIKDYSWHIANGYISAKKLDGSDREIRMHRIVLNLVDVSYNDIKVDHIHGKETRNDNRKSNLRMANDSQNNINKGLRSNNTSGVTGVSWNQKRNKWHARLWKNRQTIDLGHFSNFDDAVQARKQAEDKYFGEWSYDNSMAM